MFSRIVLCLFFASLAGLATAQTQPSKAKPAIRIGMHANVTEGGGAPEYLAAFREEIQMMLNVGIVTNTWKDLQPSSGTYVFKPLTDYEGIASFAGWQVFSGVQSINTVKREVTPGLEEAEWDSGNMLSVWREFVRRYAQALPQSVKWVSLGNEVDVYFGSHANEVDAYHTFLLAGREEIKKIRPEVKVGVTMTVSGLQSNPAVMERLQSGMDIAIYTYYPMDGFTVHPISRIPEDFKDILRFAGGKPVVLQEIGYPSSSLNGSSPEQQGQFVGAVMDLLEKNSRQFDAGYFFMQVDPSQAMLDSWRTYYGLSDPKFLGFLSSLGLKTKEGAYKPGWFTLRDRTRSLLDVRH
ncbi:MAG: hypothetical protein JST40_04065 [Armatimonadetes bacterium]|nr:hypothetical protein [Armatimonadota bacterium]